MKAFPTRRVVKKQHNARWVKSAKTAPAVMRVAVRIQVGALGTLAVVQCLIVPVCRNALAVNASIFVLTRAIAQLAIPVPALRAMTVYLRSVYPMAVVAQVDALRIRSVIQGKHV